MMRAAADVDAAPKAERKSSGNANGNKKGRRNVSADKPIAIDLFAGCGGLTRGLRNAGFHVAAAVEIDPVAARTYRWNNRHTVLIEKDIREVTADELLQAAGSKTNRALGRLCPLPRFCSLTSKCKREDPRNELLLVMGQLIETNSTRRDHDGERSGLGRSREGHFRQVPERSANAWIPAASGASNRWRTLEFRNRDAAWCCWRDVVFA